MPAQSRVRKYSKRVTAWKIFCFKPEPDHVDQIIWCGIKWTNPKINTVNIILIMLIIALCCNLCYRLWNIFNIFVFISHIRAVPEASGKICWKLTLLTDTCQVCQSCSGQSTSRRLNMSGYPATVVPMDGVVLILMVSSFGTVNICRTVCVKD